MSDRPSAERQGRDAHLKDYAKLLWKGRWTILGITVACFILAVVATLLRNPVYKATASVEIQAFARRIVKNDDMSGLGAQGFGWLAEERYFNTQLEIIASRTVAEAAVQRLQLDQDPRFPGGNDPVGALREMIQVRPLKDTGIVKISIAGFDPEAITLWVNTLANTYVDRNVLEARKDVDRVLKDVTGQLKSLRGDLESAWSASAEAAEGAGIYGVESHKSLVEAEFRQLIQEHADARIEVARLGGTKRTLDKLLAGEGDPMLIEEVTRDVTVQDLSRRRTEVEKHMASLRLSRKPGHPEYREAQSELESVTGRLEAQYASILDRVRISYEAAVEQEAYLRKELESKREEAAKAERTAGTVEVARSDAEARKTIYDLVVQRLSEMNLSAQTLSNNLRVIDEAVVPTRPIAPRKTMNLAAGLLLGLALGLGAVFFLDYLDNTVKSAEDLEHDLDLNLLAVVPRRSSRDARAVKEALQTLRTSVLFSSKGRSQNVLLMTSAGPREGKSSTIADLAVTLAATGESVMLLDCDLRRPTIHTHFELARDHGLSNYLVAREGTDWREFVSSSSTPGLSVMTCGPIPPNPPDLFNSRRFHELIQELKAGYDWVLIDSPPVISLADTVILGSLADMVALVVKHNENDKDMIRRCVKQLRDVNPNVVGAVLNSVDLQRDGSGYYYAGYYYEQADGKRVKGGRRSRGREGATREREARTAPGPARPARAAGRDAMLV